jgi:hypothetical protein
MMSPTKNQRFDPLQRPDRHDDRFEQELHSEAVSARPSIAELVNPSNFERWYHRSLTVSESIRYTDGDRSIRMCTDSTGQFTFPWRDK